MMRRVTLIGVLALLTMSLFGCASEDTPKAYVPGKLATKWISTCEQDYLSDQCTEMIIKMETKWTNAGNFLSAWIPPFEDPMKSDACSKDAESSECSALILFSNNSVEDLVCLRSENDEFGLGYFCYTVILMRNTSSAPFEDWLNFTLWDKKGVSYASDIDGTFTLGLSQIEFESEPRVVLNPGRGILKYVGFSIADLSTPLDFIDVGTGNGLLSRIHLCPTSNEAFAGDEAERTVVYEDARRLHSCKFLEPVEFEVRSPAAP